MLNKKNITRTIFIALVLLLVSNFSMAQCAMCRATVGSNLSDGRGGVIGTGINFGIVYLLLTPYVLVAGLFFTWFRLAKKRA